MDRQVKKLSNRQQQVYDFIKTYFTENGFCPSLADIACSLGLHESTVVAYVNLLKQKGLVTSAYRTARSLRIVEPREPA